MLSNILTSQAMQPRRIGHFTQGLAQLGQAFAASLIGQRAERQQQARQTAANEALMQVLGIPPGTPQGQTTTPGQPGPGGAAPGAPEGTSALGALATQGPSVAALLQTNQQFPELSGVLGPVLSAQLTPRAPTVLSPGEVAINRQGQVVARGDPKAPKFQSDLGEAVGDRQLALELFGKDSPQVQAFDELIRTERAGGGVDLTDEGGMRKEFTKASGDFVKVRDAFGKVQNASPTAAGDLALIFNYMKMLDPGSVVREGEFATAQNTAGVPDRVRNVYNRLLSGERLAPVQRQNFKTEAGNVLLSQREQQNLLEEQFKGVAGRSGLRPENVVIDFQGDLRDFEPGGDNQKPATVQEGAPVTSNLGGMTNDQVLSADTSQMSLEQLEHWNAEMDRRGL